MEYVVVYPFTVEHSITRLPLVLKKKPENLAGMLNLPGGKIEVNETPIEAAIRELREETGLEEIQEYDGMCYYPSKYMGVIQGRKSIIHCVAVPISERQELNPDKNETEEIKWYDFPDLFDIPNLMPNLRLTIPLMNRGISGWKISDLTDTWRFMSKHNVSLTFNGMANNVIDVNVRAMGSFVEICNEEEL
jgi:8-oxo-dGTP diphosphatase